MVCNCIANKTRQLQLFGDQEGEVKSPKLERGGGSFEFPGAPEIDPFLQRFYRQSPISGSKVQVLEGQLSGRVSPPLAFGTF